ncbi:hypothetical protein WMY93_020549 [Mugilogobius chulae]|uniref:Caspase-3 n=1 Tax=Mugilogobius chulae TaxID=88201 RepID=A0AAW0NJB7_9GOBI
MAAHGAKIVTEEKKSTTKTDVQNGKDAVDSAPVSQTSSSTVGAAPSTQKKKTETEETYIYQKYKNMGRCVIINNETFQEQTGASTRQGTDVDAKAAKDVFEELGYEVTVYHDRTKKQMRNILRDESDEDHTENSSFVCVILSHGNEEGIFAVDGVVKLDSLTQCFKGDECTSLLGKPKLFFLQACRGQKTDDGVDIIKGDAVDASVPEDTETKSLPKEADFLYAYSTPPGFYAWRSNCDGSWFIQALCESLREFKHLELMNIMTRVNNKVAAHKRSESNSSSFDGKKVVPCITSMLTKDWYFTK